ncbi:MAG: hypothetical protein RLZZ505_3148 [Verrucomicrobiota bacterium]|jgi:hypothetical protein
MTPSRLRDGVFISGQILHRKDKIPVTQVSQQSQPPDNPYPLVLFQRKDRLGARIEGMLSAWRFAKVTGRNLIVFWPGHPTGEYDPESLFDLGAMSGNRDLMISHSRYDDYPLKNAEIDLLRSQGWPFFLRKRDILRSPDKAVKIVTPHSTYFFFRGEFPWRVAEEIRELYSRLIPAVCIRDALTAALCWIGDPDFIAVHIRRGDVVSKIKQKLQNFIAAGAGQGNPRTALDQLMKDGKLEKDLHNFVKRVTSMDAYISALPPNNRSKLVVFSDTPEAAAEFQSRLPTSQAVLVSSFEVELNDEQRAYLELLILSKARRVISTASCFSRLACQCGRPSFHDARNVFGAHGTRTAFHELFGEILGDSEFLGRECLRVLNRHLALDRWVRMSDRAIAMLPWLTWISLK